jgi:DNA-binding MarR family transcriptional regulator
VPADSPDHRIEAIRTLARASRLLERAGGELSLAHYRVLSAIAGGDERASRVAARLALGRPTISASVDALCRRGLIQREGVAADQRATALRLTAAGTKLLAEVEAQMLARFTAVLEQVSHGERLVSSLVEFGTALDRLGDTRLRAGQVGQVGP